MFDEELDEYDVLVVGSGAGGMSAALAASLRGLSVAVVEKADRFGGTSALSGGGIWVPNNLYLNDAGLRDSPEQARAYMQATVGDRVPTSRRDRYLLEGPEMLREFHEQTRWMRWRYVRGYPDYFPEAEGGLAEGRQVEPLVLDAGDLGSLRTEMRPRLIDTKGMVITVSDFHDLVMVGRTWAGRMRAARVMGKAIASKLTRSEYLATGQALVGRLRLALADRSVPFFLSTPLKELIAEDEAGGKRVTGIRCERDGAEITLTARRGVVLAAGGFGRSQEMRERYLPAPTDAAWTISPAEQTGDAIEAGLAIGANVDLMDRVWGQPSALLPVPGGPAMPMILLAERAAPGTLIVNGAGERYANESVPYDVLYDAMYAGNRPDSATIPSWLVFDQRAKDRYMLLGMLPRQKFPQQWLENGFVRRAESLAALATEISVPPEALGRTVSRFNVLAAAGKDEDFHRGDSAYDRYYGDPRLPNPNLAPLEKPPYHAVAIYPCDLSTKGGLAVDDDARVLDDGGRPIEGLYATGNCSASVMGTTYVGPGATLGPAMVFGYTAVKHIASASAPSLS